MVVTLRLSLNYRSLLFLHLSECKFRHTSTNSNQYSRKLVKLKLYIFLMYSREFLLRCCSYLNGESEKQTHLCRTIRLSDYRTNGLWDYSYAPDSIRFVFSEKIVVHVPVGAFKLFLQQHMTKTLISLIKLNMPHNKLQRGFPPKLFSGFRKGDNKNLIGPFLKVFTAILAIHIKTLTLQGMSGRSCQNRDGSIRVRSLPIYLKLSGYLHRDTLYQYQDTSIGIT